MDFVFQDKFVGPLINFINDNYLKKLINKNLINLTNFMIYGAHTRNHNSY